MLCILKFTLVRDFPVDMRVGKGCTKTDPIELQAKPAVPANWAEGADMFVAAMLAIVAK